MGSLFKNAASTVWSFLIVVGLIILVIMMVILSAVLVAFSAVVTVLINIFGTPEAKARRFARFNNPGRDPFDYEQYEYSSPGRLDW